MKRVLLASAAFMLMAGQGYALTLPPTYAPTPVSFDGTFFDQGVTDSVANLRRSPFDTTTTPNAAYDVVYGNSSASNPYGLAATFAASAFGGSNGAGGTFKFVDGSPDSYNVLQFTLAGIVVGTYQGDQIASPTSGAGVSIVTLTGIGAYDAVSFGSINTNAFEFAALSAVPLPASLPMFGGALLALAGFSYGMNRWVAPKNKVASATV